MVIVLSSISSPDADKPTSPSITKVAAESVTLNHVPSPAAIPVVAGIALAVNTPPDDAGNEVNGSVKIASAVVTAPPLLGRVPS